MLSSMMILPLPAPPDDGNLGTIPASQVIEEDPPPSVAEQKSVATHTRTIGIIHPPPDIRTIIDKTASFVAKNGPDFEKRIIASNTGNAKFNFLVVSDPYHAYYQHRVVEYRTQLQQEEGSAQPGDTEAVPISGSADDVPVTEESSKVDANAQFRIVPPRKVLEPPESEQYTVRLPEGITGEELDIIKLTAQFVARNGKSFLTNLSTREVNNPQFHFLRPTHSLFTFFTALADAYSKVLMPSKGLTEKMKKSVSDMTTVLERCLHRLEWERSQDLERQKAEDEIEQERVQMAMIDWHEFVVVETIEFAEDEDFELPEPLTLAEVIRNSKTSSAVENHEASVQAEPPKDMEIEMDEEEMQLVEEGMKATKLDEKGTTIMEEQDNNEVKIISNEAEPPMRIVKNWKRPEDRIPAERDPTKFVVSPITGELIPISEMAEHMRISLIDPKYKEQKERMMAKLRETTLAQDHEISRNIVGLARTRPDIFGTTEEEVSNAVKAEIEKKKDEQPKQVIWDGHTGSIGWTANQAMSHGQSGEEQPDMVNNDGRALPGPAPPPLRPGGPLIRPLPPPPGLALNMPRMPPNVQYSGPPSTGLLMQQQPPRPPAVQMVQSSLRPPPPPMTHPIHPHLMAPSISTNIPGFSLPPPPGSIQTMMPPRPFIHMPMPPPNISIMPQPPLPQGMPPPPPPEEAPPLPDEPEPKKQRIDESSVIPEDEFLAQHLVCTLLLPELSLH